jgi:hypothetical protein
MSHAELCPVCKGSGKHQVVDQACHGCDGKGWVTVQDSSEQQTIPYYVPVPYYVPPTEPLNPWYPYSTPYWPPRITYYKNYETTGGRQH